MEELAATVVVVDNGVVVDVSDGEITGVTDSLFTLRLGPALPTSNCMILPPFSAVLFAAFLASAFFARLLVANVSSRWRISKAER